MAAKFNISKHFYAAAAQLNDPDTNPLMLFRNMHVQPIWSDRTVILSVLSSWTLIIAFSVTVLLVFGKSVHFELTSSGIISLKGGSAKDFSTMQSAVGNLLTVVLCSVCYLCCFIKNRKGDYKYKSVERRLFLCALASSLPFCVEMVRSITVLITSKGDRTLYALATDFWFYEMEIVVTSSMWMQLVINKNVRNHFLRTFGYKRCNTSTIFPTTT
ncbi:hypothetical protein Y032_0308g2046 [Ancylostoma ceylanicum]|uniref:Serpentine receptor class gamma n=1 Tax=Ancylostoma ceylanicum TaxID=53326 RepID=A0A016S3N3_9BILA|nr:hypothetical protein Y032_0308g2046 [Ancylostoma ceylanicum]